MSWGMGTWLVLFLDMYLVPLLFGTDLRHKHDRVEHYEYSSTILGVNWARNTFIYTYHLVTSEIWT